MTTKKTPIEKLSSTKAREALSATESRLREVSDRLAAIHPPVPRRAPAQASVNAPKRDPLEGCGPAYRQAIEDGDAEVLAGLTRERETLTAERELLDHRKDLLRDRAKDAAEEEAREQAPAKEKEHAKALPAVASKVMEARQAFDAARAELEGHIRGLKAARSLSRNDGPALGLDGWIEVEAAARLRVDDSRPTALRTHNAAGMYIGESGKTITYPALDLGLLGEPDAPSLWPKWLTARASMTPRQRASPNVPDSEEDVRRAAREIARQALVADPPNRARFYDAWGLATGVVEAQREQEAKDAQRREAGERATKSADGWLTPSKNKVGK